MTERLDKHTLKNGMVILAEPMDSVASAAFDFSLPAGAAKMPEGCCGAANIIEDWIYRGAGDKDSRQLSDALDGLGLVRGRAVGSSFLTIGAAHEASALSQALDLYADIILRPYLLDEQFELAKQLAIDEVLALDDDPRQKVMLKLKEKFYPQPLGRSTNGEIEDLSALNAETVKQLVKDRFAMSQTIFSLAGKYDFDRICRQMEDLFADVPTVEDNSTLQLQKNAGGYLHIPNDGAQVHIGLMTRTVNPADKDYYNARVAVSVLSGGMSARLFTEVREKRGLCYAIGAKYHGLKEAAGVMCYAGTIPEKAQETYDCIVCEFARLAEGITEDEIARAKVGLQSALILHSESSSSRASAVAGDYHILGRVRSLDEIKQAIEQTSVDTVTDFLRDNRFEDFTAVTIGPVEVNIKS